MRNPIFDVVEKKNKRASALEFDIGDTVIVTLRIAEGEKERLQDYEGEVIARKGSGLDEMFTVRRLVGEEGVERTFPVQSPKIAAVKVRRSGKVRRCKLYYLRDRVGKARKLSERRMTAEQREAAAKTRTAKAKATAEAVEAADAAKRDRSRGAAMAGASS